MWGTCPLLGEDLGTSGTSKHCFPVGDKWPPEPLVSASLHLVSLPSWLLGVSVPSFRQCFPFPPPFPFPSPEISLLLSLSCPSDRVDVRQLQHHSSQVVRPAPSGRQRLTLMGDRQRWERLASHRADFGPVGSP